MTVSPVPPRETIEGWEFFPHDADIGVRGYGRTLGAAFENAALAMTSAVTDVGLLSPDTDIEVNCDAPDRETLLYDWLNAIVIEMATRGMVFCEFRVTLEDCRLAANIRGEPLDPARHAPAVEVKGATFTELKVERLPDDTWMAQCVIDI